MIQAKLKSLIDEASDDMQIAYSKFKDEINQITSVKDLDYLFGKLKGQGSELMKAVEEEEKRLSEDEPEQELVITRISPVKKETQDPINDSKSFIMPVSQESLPTVNPTESKGKSNKELSTKIVKQHMEIQRLKEELE